FEFGDYEPVMVGRFYYGKYENPPYEGGGDVRFVLPRYCVRSRLPVRPVFYSVAPQTLPWQPSAQRRGAAPPQWMESRRVFTQLPDFRIKDRRVGRRVQNQLSESHV